MKRRLEHALWFASSVGAIGAYSAATWLFLSGKMTNGAIALVAGKCFDFVCEQLGGYLRKVSKDL